MKQGIRIIAVMLALLLSLALPAIATAQADEPVHTLRAFATYDTTMPGKFIDREQYPVWDAFVKLCDEYNLKIEWEVIPADQYEMTAQTRIAAANDMPDFLCLTRMDNIQAVKLGMNGTLLPINKIVDEYSDGTAKALLDGPFKHVKKLGTAPDGNMYWLANASVSMYEDGTPGYDFQLSNIRKDWLEKVNMPVPTTAEEFFNTMKAFRDQDVNGNGTADEVMNLDPVGFNNVCAQWFGLGTSLTTVDLSTGKVVSPWYQPGIKPFFEFVQRCAKEGIFEPDLIDASWEIYFSYVSGDRLGAINTYAGQNYMEPMTGNANAYYLPFGPVQGTEGITPYVTAVSNMNYHGKFAFTKACADLAGAGKFIDLLCSQKMADLSGGLEGVNYEWKDGKKESLLPDGITADELVAQKKVTGSMLWGSNMVGTMPGFSGLDGTFKETDKLRETLPDKADVIDKLKNYTYLYPDNTAAYYALPTEEQLAEKDDIISDLDTYSREMATKLCMGSEPIENLDGIIAKLKELGLDRLIEIDQQLYDRYIAE